MPWPSVAVMLITWNRPREIRRTLTALQEHLRYSGKLHWHIADDGTGGTYVQDIEADFPDVAFTHTITKRGGWGVNANTAMRFLWKEGHHFIFLCEDDYLALRPIELNRGVALMQGVRSVSLVRYDGIAAHGQKGLDLQLRMTRRPQKIPYLLILKSSAHVNVYSNRPHLKHKRFHDYHGMYPNRTALAQTETAYAKQVKRKPGGQNIAVLPDYLFTPFRHFGKSWQGTEHDRGQRRRGRRKKATTKKGKGKGKGGYARGLARKRTAEAKAREARETWKARQRA